MHQVLNENNKSPPTGSQKLALLSSSHKKLKENQVSTSKKTESKLRQQSMTRLSFPDTNGLINDNLITKSFFKEKTESLKSTELRSKPSSSSSSQVSFQYFKWKNSRYKQAQYNSEEEEIPQQQQQTYQQKFMRTNELFSINPKVIHSSNKSQSPIKNKNEKPGEKLEDNSNGQTVQTFHLPSLSFKAPNKRTLDSTSHQSQQTHRINEFASKNTKHFTTSIDGKKLIDDDRLNGKFKNQNGANSASFNEKNKSVYLKEKPLNPVDFYIKMNLVNNPNLFSAIQTNALAQNSTDVISTLTELNSNKYLPLNANSIKKLKKLLNLDEFTSLVNYRANKNKENFSFNAAETKANGKPKVALNTLTSSITNQQKNSQSSSNENSNSVNLPPVLRIEKSDLYLKWTERKQTNEKNTSFDANIFHTDESASKSYQTNDELINGEGQVPIKILIKKREEKYLQNNHQTAPWSTPQRTGSFSFSDHIAGDSLYELSNLNSKQIDTDKNHNQIDSHPEVCLLCQRENQLRNKESIDLIALDLKTINELVPTVQLHSQTNQKAARIGSPPLSPHQMFYKSISDSDIKTIKKAVCFPPPANLKTKRFI